MGEICDWKFGLIVIVGCVGVEFAVASDEHAAKKKNAASVASQRGTLYKTFLLIFLSTTRWFTREYYMSQSACRAGLHVLSAKEAGNIWNPQYIIS